MAGVLGAHLGSSGTEAEERVNGRNSYLDILDLLHRELRPAHYLEIGVGTGLSLALATGPATGIDPAPRVDRQLRNDVEVLCLTSDEFFAHHDARMSADFCLIDGLHHFDQALRDFMNFERRAGPGAVVVMDDVLPNHPAQAERTRRTRVWTGDVWRIVEVLRDYRPDLFRLVLDTSPAGLLLVAGLDPESRILWDNYEDIVRDVQNAPPPPPSVLARHDAIDATDRQFERVVHRIAELRQAGAAPKDMVSELRKIQSEASLRCAKRATTPKLSVIVVGYNMQRELPRTIRSLSCDVQRGIDPSDYEVILIDNGSARPFDETGLCRFIPDLVVRRVSDATVSPVPAINLGLSLARGDLVGVWIDGARMASPGLLAAALAASRLHPKPVIGTHAFHIGSKSQGISAIGGYDQAKEDALLKSVSWENDGYRLFSISTFGPSSGEGWLTMPWECNALFLRAEHWQAIGGYDERFRSPGGGFANLDMWRRACGDPGAQVFLLLGEATFHQFHAGVSTSAKKPPMATFEDEYARIRGMPYEPPSQEPVYLGSMPSVARDSLRVQVYHSPPVAALRRQLRPLRRAYRGLRARISGELPFMPKSKGPDSSGTLLTEGLQAQSRSHALQCSLHPETMVRDRYIDLLVKSVSNLIYGPPPLDPWHDGLFGRWARPGRDRRSPAHTMVGKLRVENVRDLALHAIQSAVPGDFIETGVWRGGCCILMRGILAACQISDRKVYVVDSFEGLPPPNKKRFPQDARSNLHRRKDLAVSLDEVKANFAQYGLLDDQVVFVKGFFSDTLPKLAAKPFSLIRLDGDMYESTYVALENLYPKLSPGGFIIVDDYGAIPACRAAVVDYRAKMKVQDEICPIDHTGIWWQKSR